MKCELARPSASTGWSDSRIGGCWNCSSKTAPILLLLRQRHSRKTYKRRPFATCPADSYNCGEDGPLMVMDLAVRTKRGAVGTVTLFAAMLVVIQIEWSI